MLKRPITYEDFEGNKITEDFYFNLTASEIIELEVSMPGGLSAFLQKIVDTVDEKELVGRFKWLILKSYGVKSEDGRRFVKSDELSLQFSQMPAYDALFIDLTTNATAAAAFVNGIIPKDVVKKIADQTPQDKPVGPPLPPARK